MTTIPSPTLLNATAITKKYGNATVLDNINLSLMRGEVHCLLGDNGAGKSTFIKIVAGAIQPTSGTLSMNTIAVHFNEPADALKLGIATVYQDLAIVSMMSITRNFFLGNELTTGKGLFKRLDKKLANQIVASTMNKMGIHIKSPEQAAGTLSGGERQVLAIARAVHFGAKVLILDEPTSALGVAQTANVLHAIQEIASRGIGIIFITHNARDALKVADSFTILKNGRCIGNFKKQAVDLHTLQDLMAGEEDQRPTHQS